MGEHAHLSYAATAYGVQGATVDRSHTVLTEATSAAGIYVGMTRGREQNRLHVIAEDMADARAQFVAAMERDPADGGLDHATARAAATVRGIAKNGPIRRVAEELARLDREAERAEQQAERWEQTATRLEAQRAAHRIENDKSTAVLRRAEKEAVRVRAEIAAPLTVQAEADGVAYLAVIDTKAATKRALASPRWDGSVGARPAPSTTLRPSRPARSERRSATPGMRSRLVPLRRSLPGQPRRRHDEPKPTRA